MQSAVAYNPARPRANRPPEQYDDVRLVEVGFKYTVTDDDVRGGARFPPGALIKGGFYIFPNYRPTPAFTLFDLPLAPYDPAKDLWPHIEFISGAASTVNEVDAANVCEVVTVRNSRGDKCVGFYMVNR